MEYNISVSLDVNAGRYFGTVEANGHVADFSAELPGSMFHGEDVIEFPSRLNWYPKPDGGEAAGGCTCSVTFKSITPGYELYAAGEKIGSTYRQQHVAKHYGFAISNKLASVSRSVRGIEVTAAYFCGHGKWAEFILDAAADALEFFIDFLGFYPYKSFTVLPGSTVYNGGYIFAPGIVFVHNFAGFDPDNKGYIDYYRVLTAHEIAHQYFGEYVIDNGDPAWLWLGLGLALDREYALKIGVDSFHQHIMDDYAENPRDLHGKAYAAMCELMQAIGKDCFFNIMRRILQNYGGRVLSPKDFAELCKLVSQGKHRPPHLLV